MIPGNGFQTIAYTALRNLIVMRCLHEAIDRGDRSVARPIAGKIASCRHRVILSSMQLCKEGAPHSVMRSTDHGRLSSSTLLVAHFLQRPSLI